jgi:hypothetical protein
VANSKKNRQEVKVRIGFIFYQFLLWFREVATEAQSLFLATNLPAAGRNTKTQNSTEYFLCTLVFLSERPACWQAMPSLRSAGRQVGALVAILAYFRKHMSHGGAAIFLRKHIPKKRIVFEPLCHKKNYWCFTVHQYRSFLAKEAKNVDGLRII